jgi:hypothetical protein
MTMRGVRCAWRLRSTQAPARRRADQLRQANERHRLEPAVLDELSGDRGDLSRVKPTCAVDRDVLKLASAHRVDDVTGLDLPSSGNIGTAQSQALGLNELGSDLDLGHPPTMWAERCVTTVFRVGPMARQSDEIRPVRAPLPGPGSRFGRKSCCLQGTWRGNGTQCLSAFNFRQETADRAVRCACSICASP